MNLFNSLEEFSDKGYEITILNQLPESMTGLPKWGVSIFTYQKRVPNETGNVSCQYAWNDKLETAIELAIDKALNG